MSILRTSGKTPLLNPDFSVDTTADLEKKYDVTKYSSSIDAYSDSYDLVVISTPTSIHAPDVLEALDQGCDVFVEKPGASSLKEALEIQERVQETQRFFISYQRRFHPLVEKTRKIIEENKLGSISLVKVSVSSFVPAWHPYEDFRQLYACKKSLGGGVLRTEIHELDFLTSCFGLPKDIKATGGTRGAFKIDVEDSVELILDYGSFAILVDLNFMRKLQERTIKVLGSEGLLELDLFRNRLALQLNDQEEDVVQESVSNDDMFEFQLDYFINDFKAGNSEYIQSLVDNATVVDECLRQIS